MKALKGLAILILMSNGVCGQKKTYTRAELQSDFNLARHALQESHPGIYRYASKPEMDKRFDDAYAAIKDSMSEQEFYKLVARPIISIGCGHTGVGFSNSFTKTFPKKRLPFDIRIVDQRRMYVSKSFSPDIEPGMEIASINNVAIGEIISSFMPFIKHDGFITTGRIKWIERTFPGSIRTLFEDRESYRISFVDKSGSASLKTIALISSTSIPEQKEKPALEYAAAGKTGILTIRSFDGSVKDASRNGYNVFLATSFAKMQSDKIQNLIIDLRDNGGGNDEYGALLFRYLTDAPFKYYAYLEIDKPTISFIRYTDQSPGFKDELAGLAVNTNGRYFFKETSHPCLSLQQPQANHFDKNVYLLINGGSFSATAEFASIARYKKRAFFIGEETGGAYEGNTSGYGALLTLPNTGISIRIPMLKYVTAVEADPLPRGRGIMPDLEVMPTIQGIIGGRDEVMEKAMANAQTATNEPRK